MADILIDNPLIVSMLFHPRRAEMGRSRIDGVHDGTIATSDGVKLGYRLYKSDARTLIVFFHGNGEVASDYDDLASYFHRTGASLLVMDYRGYGWSEGKPVGSRLLPDAEAAFNGLHNILAAHGIPSDVSMFIMGRSLGSAPAIHLAYTFPDTFKGLILDSAFAHTPSLLKSIGIPTTLLQNIRDPFANEQKIASVKIPLLVIHGERDTLIPIEHGQRLYDASPSTKKVMMRVPRAGHNDILAHDFQAYFAALKKLINDE
jgi:pimeloyl-ACP methyl ester carboxylesterase